MTRRSTLVATLVAVTVMALPGVVGAEPPTTTAPPVTTAVPAVAPPATAAESAIAVGDEVAYRAALAALSVDASGPHTIDLTADVVVDDGTDPIYTGSRPLTIDGQGFALDGVGTSRLLVMDSPTDAGLTLTDVTLRGGSAVGDGGAVLVRNASVVEVTDARFEENEASGSGGAIAMPLAATVLRSDFIGNVAVTGDGGALDAAAPAGEFVIEESLFTANRAPAGAGGAVSAIGFPQIGSGDGVLRSTFIANSAQRGGALVLAGGGVIANSTLADNTATVSGGGLLVESGGGAALIYATLTGNGAPDGANLAHDGAQLFVFFSVFAEPVGGGENCRQGDPWTADLLHADDDSCGGAGFNGGSPELGPIGDNGGRTPTREPLPGSPLIDAIPDNYGYPSLPGGCAGFQGLDPVDQRGVVRPQDGDGENRRAVAQGEPVEVAADCDIGAVEARAVVAPPIGPVSGAPSFTG